MKGKGPRGRGGRGTEVAGRKKRKRRIDGGRKSRRENVEKRE